ncbi:unnamed protein product, partial [Ixodes persulcatus]
RDAAPVGDGEPSGSRSPATQKKRNYRERQRKNQFRRRRRYRTTERRSRERVLLSVVPLDFGRSQATRNAPDRTLVEHFVFVFLWLASFSIPKLGRASGDDHGTTD